MRLYILGEVLCTDPLRWELKGCYDDELAAIIRCETTQHFVGPIFLNRTLPEQTSLWHGCYYPMLGK